MNSGIFFDFKLTNIGTEEVAFAYDVMLLIKGKYVFAINELI